MLSLELFYLFIFFEVLFLNNIWNFLGVTLYQAYEKQLENLVETPTAHPPMISLAEVLSPQNKKAPHNVR